MNNRNLIKPITIIIVIVLILLSSYFLQKYNNKTKKDYKPSVTISSVELISNATSTLIKNNWGVVFVKRDDWSLATNTDSQIVLEKTKGVSKGDKITISYKEGNSIEDGGSKFYFNKSSNSWMMDDKNAWIVLKLNNKIPVMMAKSAFRTYIVAISNTKFIKLNLTGGGNTEPLDNIVNNIMLIDDLKKELLNITN